MTKKTFYKMPDGQWVKKERTYKTKYLQSPRTGLMQGRKGVSGVGDKTGVRRVQQDFVLVKKSNRSRGHVRKVYNDGMILGRY